MKLTRYKSHKTVEAEKIISVTGTVVGLINDESVVVSDEWLTRFKPEAPFDLGYYVRYEDGYESWSPTDAFEGGYDRMQGLMGDLDRATERFGQVCAAAACRYAAELLTRNLKPGKVAARVGGVDDSIEELCRIAQEHDKAARDLE